jgi:predicted transposase YbfD/YdcC
MDLTIFAAGMQTEAKPLDVDAASLYKAFDLVKDQRKSRGKRYPLSLILTLTLLGKLAGETTINGIVDWVKERKMQLRQLLNWPRDFPVNSTYSHALAHCDGQEVAKVIAHVLLKARAVERCGSEPSRLLANSQEQERLIQTAMDGKTLRGTLGHASEEQPPVHLLSLYECESGIVLTQQAVKSKENEITAAAALLHPLLVKGRIISADAMHTQRKWCTGVHVYGGYYLALAKENQPATLQDIRDYFEDKDADQRDWHVHKKVQKGHGRIETREIWTSTEMNEWFQEKWTGIAQIFRIHRSRKRGGKEQKQIVYGFTNLPREKANAQYLLELNQKHWAIENRLHYRRDKTLGEDACQIRRKDAPQTLAALNGGILALMDWLKVSNMASQMRHFCAHPHEALQLLLGKLSR